MKKTTVRFAAVGTVLLLAALALGLAQHDARQSRRDSAAPIKLAAEAPQPIVVDDIDPKWLEAHGQVDSVQTLVRANDDLGSSAPPSLEYEPSSNENPLRPLASLKASATEIDAAASQYSDDSSVVQAAGEGPSGTGLPLPALPPSLGAAPLVDAHTGVATADVRSGTSAGSTLPPGWINSGPATSNQNLSETRQQLVDALRQAAPATGLPSAGLPAGNLPASNLPSVGIPAAGGSSAGLPAANAPSSSSQATSRGVGQAWLQAPPALPKTLGTQASLSDSANVSGSSPSAAGSGAATVPIGSGVMPPSTSSTPPSSTPTSSNLPTSNLSTSSSAQLPSTNSPLTAPSVNRSLSDDQGNSPFGLPAAGSMPSTPAASLGAPQPLGDSFGSASSSQANTGRGATSAQNSAPPRTSSPANARTLLTGSALGTLVSNQPGNRHLDGSQNPIMLIQKRMAGECQVGKRATVVITVRNAGNSTAQDVQVIDSVPIGASFAEAMPAVTPTAEGVLVWSLGEMAPGDERTINLQIVPERQGELGSTAVVRFAAQASVRTLATLPKLELTQSSSPEVLIGSPHAIDVVVKNVGTGVARGVRLEADVPTNLRHESGKAILEASFGEIAPNESRHIRLDATAIEPGQGVCAIRALTEDGLQQEQKVELRVLAPALRASIVGPTLKYLDRQATFKVMIKNTGTASATNCEFVMRLPSGLNFNTANKEGTYDAKQHAVFWSVPEFPAGHSEPVELTVLPVEVGVQAMSFQGTADLGVKTEAQGNLTVAEQGELAFKIEQDADPIEVSASTTYTVEVRNVGRVDHNVQLAVQLPAGSKALKVDAPVKYSILGDQLVFEPIPEMESRAVQKFRIEVGGFQVGTQIVRAQLKSQNRPTPVVKEEATDVYNDRNQAP